HYLMQFPADETANLELLETLVCLGEDQRALGILLELNNWRFPLTIMKYGRDLFTNAGNANAVAAIEVVIRNLEVFWGTGEVSVRSGVRLASLKAEAVVEPTSEVGDSHKKNGKHQWIIDDAMVLLWRVWMLGVIGNYFNSIGRRRDNFAPDYLTFAARVLNKAGGYWPEEIRKGPAGAPIGIRNTVARYIRFRLRDEIAKEAKYRPEVPSGETLETPDKWDDIRSFDDEDEMQWLLATAWDDEERKVLTGKLRGKSMQEIAADCGTDIRRVEWVWLKIRKRKQATLAESGGARMSKKAPNPLWAKAFPWREVHWENHFFDFLADQKTPHPNLPQVRLKKRWFGRWGDFKKEVRYVPGQTLRHSIGALTLEPFDSEDVREERFLRRWFAWMIQIADTQACLEERGFKHEDLHSKNVIIRSDNSRPVFIDLGPYVRKELTAAEALNELCVETLKEWYFYQYNSDVIAEEVYPYDSGRIYLGRVDALIKKRGLDFILLNSTPRRFPAGLSHYQSAREFRDAMMRYFEKRWGAEQLAAETGEPWTVWDRLMEAEKRVDETGLSPKTAKRAQLGGSRLPMQWTAGTREALRQNLNEHKTLAVSGIPYSQQLQAAKDILEVTSDDQMAVVDLKELAAQLSDGRATRRIIYEKIETPLAKGMPVVLFGYEPGQDMTALFWRLRTIVGATGLESPRVMLMGEAPVPLRVGPEVFSDAIRRTPVIAAASNAPAGSLEISLAQLRRADTAGMRAFCNLALQGRYVPVLTGIPQEMQEETLRNTFADSGTNLQTIDLDPLFDQWAQKPRLEVRADLDALVEGALLGGKTLVLRGFRNCPEAIYILWKLHSVFRGSGMASPRVIVVSEDGLDLKSCGTQDEGIANLLKPLQVHFTATGAGVTNTPAKQIPIRLGLTHRLLGGGATKQIKKPTGLGGLFSFGASQGQPPKKEAPPQKAPPLPREADSDKQQLGARMALEVKAIAKLFAAKIRIFDIDGLAFCTGVPQAIQREVLDAIAERWLA
ncbi:MAG: hypothetical protein WCG06_02690, partial [Candidatus Omnitrophota bacterium]